MLYRFAKASDLKIPGRMELDELGFLGALAAQVPRGGKIVEVGALYGRSSAVIAAAQPEADLFAIDSFETAPWIDKYRRSYAGIPPFSLQAFHQFTAEHSNIVPIKGMSPGAVQGWSDPIDMYFEDATHGNPILKANLDFWSKHLRPGGILCGHDYGLRFPDVKREVDAIAAKWGQKTAIVGSLWALRKPQGTPSSQNVVSDPLDHGAPFRLTGANKKKGETTVLAGYWLGSHLDADRLDWLSIESGEPSSTIRLQIRLSHPIHGQTDWIQATEKVRLVQNGKTRPFNRLAIRFAPDCHSSDQRVFYRVSARQIGNNGQRHSGISGWASDGQWASYSPNSAAISSVTVRISDQNLPDDQIMFRSKPRARIRLAGRALKRTILERT